jgi:hypothetical protein
MDQGIVHKPSEPPSGLGVTDRFATPILLLIYRRPDTTRQVIESIRSIRPTRLYVAADGPKAEVEGEAEKCAEARRLATATDWDCELHTLFREGNLGCALGVSSAITWFFDHVEEGIILEDDCVPSRSFFAYSAELLDFYREETRVMHVSGANFQYGKWRGKASYYFSRYPGIWGWASWRRAWSNYDFSLAEPEIRKHTWDAQWHASIGRAGGMAVTPNRNLVSNIGFGSGAHHTITVERFSFLPAVELAFPLVHPPRIAIDRKADEFTYYSHYRNVANLRLIWWYRIWDFVYARLKRAKQYVFRNKPLFRS